MAFVNVLVACLSRKRTLAPSLKCEWQVNRSTSYHDSIQTRIASTSELSYDLVQAEVGTGKEKMDNVDLDFPVIPVIENHACGDTIEELYYSFCGL